MSSSITAPEGIINPPIDELLEATDSKYSLVIYAAKRARQINAYYSQLGEGLLEYVGPLVDTHVHEKPLSIALREINAGLLTSEAIEPRPSKAPGIPFTTGPAEHLRACGVSWVGTTIRAARVGRAGCVEEECVVGKPKVVLGVSGGIAAYKACELLRRLTESGHDVRVVPTASSLNFVGEATWAALSGNPASTQVWETVHEVPHVRIGQGADLVVVAPATADMLAKAAHGLADDLLTNTLLTARCPVVFAPAMHTEMWEHPATQENVATLRRRGAVVIEPAVGRLTGKDTGKGRLPDPEEIFEVCRQVLRRGTAAPTWPAGTS